MNATVRRTEARLLWQAGRPTLVVNEYAELSCGCRAYVGLRLDNHEAACGFAPCSEAHEQLVGHASMLLRESLVEPGPELLIDVCARLLDEAERHVD